MNLASLETNHILIIFRGNLFAAHSVPQFIPMLARKLVAVGYLVTVLSSDAKLCLDMPRDVTFENQDFLEIEDLQGYLSKFDQLTYLGYETFIATSEESCHTEFIRNLSTISKLFINAANLGKKVIFFSPGSAVYGEPKELPLVETHELNPLNCYGFTSSQIEQYASFLARTNNFRFVCLRQSNVFGIGQRPFSGQGFIPTAIATILNGESVKIFGQGDAIRDYIYIDDLVLGAFEVIKNSEITGIYNLGTGVGVSTTDIISELVTLMNEVNFEVKVVRLPLNSIDVSANILDSRKIHKEIGWCAATTLPEGLRQTRDWIMAEGL